MTSRQAGRRIGATAVKRRADIRRRGGMRQVGRRREEPMGSKERRYFIQLVACGGIFVLLVAVKLLLPGRIAQLNQLLAGSLEQNIDVQAVFSAVGRAFAGESNVSGAAKEVYRAVFYPEEPGEILETASIGELPLGEVSALDSLQAYRKEPADGLDGKNGETKLPEGQTEASTLAYVLYSDQNLPSNVSLEQAILGFDYRAPLSGALTSNFGYREHPVEGEERFHYGVDLAADTGTEIGCFADGTVTTVGESSSYGKYCVVAHEGGYSTLYAHCSRITASSGTAVTRGQKIAEVGETGIATGPHLHFELQRGSVYLNPIYYVAGI